jgi:hypothetical protein
MLQYILFSSMLSFPFYIAGFAIPVAGFFVLPMSATALAVLSLKKGVFAGLAGMIIAALLVYKFVPAGGDFLLPFIILVAVNCAVMSSLVRCGFDGWRAVFAAYFLVACLLAAAMVLLVAGGFQTAWLWNSVVAGLPKEMGKTALEIFERDSYSLILIFAGIHVLLSYVDLAASAPRFGLSVRKLPEFGTWRCPEWVVFFLIAAMALLLAGKKISGPALPLIAENFLIVVTFFYFVGGFALAKHFFAKSKLMTYITYLFFFFYPPAAVFLAIADVWLDFRKRGGGRNEDNTEAGS